MTVRKNRRRVATFRWRNVANDSRGTIPWIGTTIASPSRDRERLAALRMRPHRPRLIALTTSFTSLPQREAKQWG